MIAIVTGADGFVGPYLIRELQSKGYKVIGTYLKDEPKGLPPDVMLHKLDILDEKAVLGLFDRSNPMFVFHLAGISDVKFSLDNPDLTHKVNVEGTKNIISAAEDMDKSPGVLLVGSAEEYGIPQFTPISEDHPLKPITPYAESKTLAEQLGRESAKRGFRVILARSFNHIGPGQTDRFVTASFARQIADIEKKGKGKGELLVGNLEARRDFTDVRDVVRAYVTAVEKGEPGDPYNICSGHSYEIKDILNRLLALSSAKIIIKEDPAKMRKSDIPIMLGDPRKIFRKTGWRPVIPIEESLNDILEYWRHRK